MLTKHQVYHKISVSSGGITESKCAEFNDNLIERNYILLPLGLEFSYLL